MCVYSVVTPLHLSPAYKTRSRNATPHSEHARVASFRVCVAAIQSPIVKTSTLVLPPGTSSVPPRSVPPRNWFLVRGCIISVTYRSSSYSGRWRTSEDGRCLISSPNIQYCALASKYVRRYRSQTNYILHAECYLFDVPAHIWHSGGALRVLKIRPFCIKKDYSLTF